MRPRTSRPPPPSHHGVMPKPPPLGKGRSVVRPMGTVAYRGKGQGKGKGRGEGRLGQGGRGRSKGGEKLMGTTAYGGKGSKGRAANGDRPVGAASCRRDHHTMASCQNPPPLQTRSSHHGVMPKPPPPLIPRMTWIAPPRGLLGRGTRRACREHANDTATQVELPVKKIWYSESASTRHDSVALHRRGYGMR